MFGWITNEVLYPYGGAIAISPEALLTSDLQISKAFPAVEYLGSESGAVYEEQREVSGDWWYATNASFETVAAPNEWAQVNATLASYATVLRGNGSMQRLSAAAGSAAPLAWVTLWTVDALGGQFNTPAAFTTNAEFGFNAALTWNAGAAIMSAVKVNVIDTSSNAASLLQDFQIGGTSVWSVRKDGTLTVGIVPAGMFSGILPIANGGTGAATFAAAHIAVTNANNNFSTTQTAAGLTSTAGVAVGGALSGATTGAFTGTVTSSSAIGFALSSTASNSITSAATGATTGFILNNTGSATTLLLDMQKAGTSQWKVGATGATTQLGALTMAGVLSGVTSASFSSTFQAAGITSTAGVAVGGALTGATTGAFSGAVTATGGFTSGSSQYNATACQINGPLGVVGTAQASTDIVAGSGTGTAISSGSGDLIASRGTNTGLIKMGGAVADGIVDYNIFNPGGISFTNLGGLYVPCFGLSFTNSSDKRFKTNIAAIKYGTAALMKLKPKSFMWKETKKRGLGFIAQEIKKVLPELVSSSSVGLGVDYSGIIPVLVQAFQELRAELTITRKALRLARVAGF